jgi:hypothetical protein
MAESLQVPEPPEPLGFGEPLVEGLAVLLGLGVVLAEALPVGDALGEALGPAAPDEASLPRPVSSQRTPRTSATTTRSTRTRRNQ